MFYKYLIQQGRDVQWLATQLGVSHQTVYNWKLGKNKPRPPQLKKMAQLLRIPIAKLYAHFYG